MVKIGFWVDLTNSTRFYDKKEIEESDCRYTKIPCRGHGETPSEKQTDLFIHLVRQFISKSPLEAIGVHCTHGFNRTGFMIVSYMVEEMDCSVPAALSEFAKIRPPGIYKEDYILELFRRYDDVQCASGPPPLPDWSYEDENNEEDVDDDSEDKVQQAQESSESDNGKIKTKGKRHSNIKKNSFMAGVPGVQAFHIEQKLHQLQKKVQRMCEWNKNSFPGSQPVSMDIQNLRKLHEKPYRVSWKADGQRYMMLIDGEDEVYFFDRDHCVFKINSLQFLHRKDLGRHLTNTLLDGEMVIDKVDGKDIPRFLCYDIIKFENQDVGKSAFYPNRLKCIENEIVGPRHEAMKKGLIDKSKEPFSVRLKQFWDVTMAHQLLGEKFAKNLSHEPDGLIFQPSVEPYLPGSCEDVLKWKPGHMNSVDFKLQIVTEGGAGILPRKIGHLYVGQLERPFATMKLTKTLKELNNKIIECKYENNQWIFMRERTDKSYPNSFNTATAVYESIRCPVTKEKLLEFIDNHRFHDDSDIMPPPSKRRAL